MKKEIIKDNFENVAHVIPVGDCKEYFKWDDVYYLLMAVYINKYGSEVGCLCRNVETREIISMDSYLYEEFIATNHRFYA